jgi:hypothetical protein
MAQLVLGAVGAGIGAAFGGPAGAALGWSAGNLLGGIVFPPKGTAQSRGRIDDLQVTGSGYGAMIPQIWGNAKVGGNIIWARDLVERKREEQAGGKGGPTQEITTYSYFANFAAAICAGPIDEVLKIWAEDTLIYDSTESPETKFDITIYLGDETQTADPFMESFEGAGEVPAYRGLAYVVFNMLPLKKFGNRIPNLMFEVTTGAETVASIAAGVFSQVGLSVDEYDTSGAASRSVEGFVLQSVQSAKDTVEPLFTAFSIDLLEADGQLLTLARGGAVELTIPEEDLGTHFFTVGAEPVAPVQTRRTQEWEIPAEVSVTYFSSDKGYETGSQRAVRYTKPHVAEKLTVTLPCVLTDTRARRTAESILYEQWVARELFKIFVGPKYLKTLPGTVVNLPVAGSTVRCRVVGIDTALFGPLDMTLVRDDAEVLNQVIEGGSLGTITESLENPDTIAFIPFCCNALTDEDADSVGYYMIAAGEPGWTGVNVYQKRSGNAYRLKSNISDPATYGTALTVLPSGTSTGILQPSTVSVDVRLETGTVETTSIDDVLAGANVALLGDEVIQFTTAVYLGGADYRLSGLIRGRRGTDYAWGDHAINERFILLTAGTVIRVNTLRDLIGKTISLKAITESEQLADVAPVNLEITGQELKPYAPVHITGSRDGSDNLTIEWVRRVRKNGELQDYSDVELDQPHERYEVEVWTPGFGALVRTISGLTGPTATYTAAQQTTDFGSPQPAVSVLIYQLGDFKAETTTSRMRGYPGEAVI